MNDDDLNAMIRSSAPASVASSPRIAAELRNVAAGSRKSGFWASRRRLTLGLVIPALLAPVAAVGLTAGVETRQIPDFAIPIEFTTDAGEQIECSVNYFNGELLWVEVNSDVSDFLKTQDWAGIGQRIYDRAAEKVASNDPEVLPETIGTLGGEPDPAMTWAAAWAVAKIELVDQRVPEELFREAGYGSDNNCQEQLP